MSGQMTKADRDALIKIARARAKQAEREADARSNVLYAEVVNQITAEYEAHDALWADAVSIAEEATAKANADIQAQCAALGIPSQDAPQIQIGWMSRSMNYSDRNRRSELYKLAEARLAALNKTAKTAIQSTALDIEEHLVLGGLESSHAREFMASMPTVEQLMPALSLEDLGVVRWQPPEGAAAQLTTPLSASARRHRLIRRVIVADPNMGDHEVAEMVGDCDHETVAAARRESAGELPASTDFKSLRARVEERE